MGLLTDLSCMVGGSVFAFNSDNKVPNIDGYKAHRSIKIGTVVCINTITDSLVFGIFPYISESKHRPTCGGSVWRQQPS
jgi:hypothetical protein